MDKEFNDKLKAVSEGANQGDHNRQSEQAISFHASEAGLVLVEASKGSFEYRLKPLQELYASGKSKSVVMNTDDPRVLQLLFTIEGAIKRRYEKDPGLTDSSVLLALDGLAMKPEFVSNDVLARDIRNSLRLLLSTDDYARDEVKMALRKILASVKRHKAAAGMRGYLDFIMEYVP